MDLFFRLCFYLTDEVRDGYLGKIFYLIQAGIRGELFFAGGLIVLLLFFYVEIVYGAVSELTQPYRHVVDRVPSVTALAVKYYLVYLEE